MAGALSCDLHRAAFAGRAIERLDHPRLADGVRAPEQRLTPVADRGADVLELEAVAVRGRNLDDLALAAALEHDPRRAAVPRVGEHHPPLGTAELELVAARDVEAAVDRREHVAVEAQQAGEARV